MQSFMTNFAENGDPNGKGLPDFPGYGDGGSVLQFGVDGVKVIGDETDNERCAWWQKALYF
jgi:carboxylesterase type B